VTPNETISCPRCATRLKPDAPAGLCLRCLLSFGLKDNADDWDAAFPALLLSGNPPAADEFDRFRIFDQLGEGGCGIVYRAEQLQPVRREVALKVIKLGMDSTSVIARFEAERQTLAMMDHPGIAKFFDAGRSRGGRPFFAMEKVAGPRITDYCDQKHLSIAQRLELFARVCDAVQHAHHKGIIHRDLKPSNILVTYHDGVAQPKVIDFGIARAMCRQHLADKTIYTAFEQFMGTPAYMSPEQAGATGEDVDTRSDVYSLGVLLYELLTGSPPFEPGRLRHAAVHEIFRIIRDEDPARPSSRLTMLSESQLSDVSRRRFAAPQKLVRELRGDLDWVVMKALEKLPARRYETASALSNEIRRHLIHEPVQARPPSTGDRFHKMVRRNKLAVVSSTAVFVALVSGLAVATWRFYREQEARRQAVVAETKARTAATRAEQVARLLTDMLAGAGPSVAMGRDATMLRELLDLTASRLHQELKAHPDIEAELRTIVGRVYSDIGQWEQSEAMFREALRLRESFLGPTNAAVGESLKDVISTLNHLSRHGDVAEAEHLGRRAVALQQALAGSEHSGFADALEQLGWNLFNQKRYIEAEPLYRHVVAIRRRSPATPELHLVNALNSLSAVVAFDPGKLGEAETLIRESLAIQTRVHGESHPVLADLLLTLSIVLERKGDLAAAESAVRSCLALRRKVLGENHGQLPSPMHQLAVILIKQDRLDDAAASCLEAIAIQTKLFGPKHPLNRDRHLRLLTEILVNQAKWPEAGAAIQEWLALCRVPECPPSILLQALRRQATLFARQNKWGEAEAPLREALTLCDTLGSAPQPLTSPTSCAQLRLTLGESLVGQGKFPEAEPMLLSSYQIFQSATNHLDRLNVELSLKALTKLYETTARPVEAAEWYQKLTKFQKSQSEKIKAAPNP
jgi:serine/threonine protein kinase/tetratricopeptide (TPR) repeat protein